MASKKQGSLFVRKVQFAREVNSIVIEAERDMRAADAKAAREAKEAEEATRKAEEAEEATRETEEATRKAEKDTRETEEDVVQRECGSRVKYMSRFAKWFCEKVKANGWFDPLIRFEHELVGLANQLHDRNETIEKFDEIPNFDIYRDLYRREFYGVLYKLLELVLAKIRELTAFEFEQQFEFAGSVVTVLLRMAFWWVDARTLACVMFEGIYHFKKLDTNNMFIGTGVSDLECKVLDEVEHLNTYPR